MKSVINGARLSVLSVALCGAFSLHAQTQVAGTLQDVFVTASRYDQAVQSSPVSSSVITAAQIKASGASDANEVIRKVLGIPYRTDLYGGRNFTLDMRGYGPTADQNLVVVVDGLRISENDYGTARLSAIDADSIESIEVVHGASSVQWGEGAIAGLINILLKKSAQQGVSGSGALDLASFGGVNVRANVRAGGEHMNVDANVRSATSRGYRDNNAYREETASIGLSGMEDRLKWHARLSGENQGSRFPGSLAFDKFASEPRQTNTPNDFGNFEETRVSSGAEYRTSNWLFGLDVGGRVKDSDSYFKGTSVFTSTNKNNGVQVSPRIGYSIDIGKSALFLLAGADYQTWDYKATNNAGQNESAKQNNEGGYVTADLLLPSGTRIIAGVRSENVAKSASDPANFIDYTRPNALDAWDLGVNQELHAGLNLYGRAAQAYRVSNVDDNRYLTTALKPQISRDVEFGIKWNHGEAGSGALRMFQQDTTNEIAYDPTIFSNINLDPTRRIGIEVEGNMALSSNLRLSGSIQKLQAHYAGGVSDGKEFPLVSSVSAALRLSWQLDQWQSVDLGVQHLGDARFGDDNSNICAAMIPASTTLDARYAWKQAAWEWSVQGNNLADQSSYSYAYSCTAGSLYPDNGRSLKLGMKYKF
jgi:iron complex outermembrane receptor protein